MPLANQNRLIAGPAMLVAVCFCLLGMAQAARPLRCTGPNAATAFAAPQQHLTRHAMQEVGPRNPQPQAPYAIGQLPVVPVAQRYALPRIAVYVPLWPIENWPAHRRVSQVPADLPDPA